MNIGVPLEIMSGEGRVPLTPLACKSLVDAGHAVYLQKCAGEGSGYTDSEYREYGVHVLASALQLYDHSQLIIKVKQPLNQDIQYLRPDHVLFSYLHLAANPELVKTLCNIGLKAIPFESVRDDNGHLPLLAPMSEVAGKISILRGASLLFRNHGGNGTLLGGIDGSDTGNVVILGAGVAGSHAAMMANALGAKVDVLDINQDTLASLKKRYPGINTHHSSKETIEALCIEADLVIGAVMVAGRRAPVVLKQSTINKMRAGSVIIDIAIDQGGCVEDIRPTSSNKLFYIHNHVIHSAVPNMPAAAARTSSQALSTAILPYVLSLASDDNTTRSSTAALKPGLINATAIEQGKVTDEILNQELHNIT